MVRESTKPPSPDSAGPAWTRDEAALFAAVRRIIQASDVFSKRLHRATGLTTAQALTLRTIAAAGETTTRKLSDAVSLSPATLTSVLDRLEANGLVERYRSATDRRVVHARLTPRGAAQAAETSPLLDSQFIDRFRRLPAKRRKEISSALLEAAGMMNADATDAAPAVNGRSLRSAKRG